MFDRTPSGNPLWRLSRSSLLLVTSALFAAGCDAWRGEGGVVIASVADHRLTAGIAAGLLGPSFRGREDAVSLLAEVWVNHMLLALAASEDTSLASPGMEAVAQRQREQEMVLRLARQEVHVDTVLGDLELRALYQEEAPGAQVTARHILLGLPPDASPQARDSVFALARELRDRILQGSDWNTLALDHSTDSGSRDKGGLIGPFPRGRMAGPFEDAAFSLQPGEVSEPVESSFGVHVIRVEERTVPPFEDSREAFRRQVLARRRGEAEAAFVEALLQREGLQLAEDAVQKLRALALDPESASSPQARGAILAEYGEGRYTVGDFVDYVDGRQPGSRAQLSGLDDIRLRSTLRDLVRWEILVLEARRLGITLAPNEEESLVLGVRAQLREHLTLLGFGQLEPLEEEAVATAVRGSVARAITGSVTILPLGPLAGPLRERYGARLYPSRYPTVLAILEKESTGGKEGPAS